MNKIEKLKHAIGGYIDPDRKELKKLRQETAIHFSQPLTAQGAFKLKVLSFALVMISTVTAKKNEGLSIDLLQFACECLERSETYSPEPKDLDPAQMSA